VVYQSSIVARLVRVQRLFKCVQNELRGRCRTDAPTDDATGEHVNHERHVQPALPFREGSKRQGVVELFPRPSSPVGARTGTRTVGFGGLPTAFAVGLSPAARVLEKSSRVVYAGRWHDQAASA